MKENQTNSASNTQGSSGLSYNLVDTLQYYEVKEITPLEFARMLSEVRRDDPVSQESLDPEWEEEYREAA